MNIATKPAVNLADVSDAERASARRPRRGLPPVRSLRLGRRHLQSLRHARAREDTKFLMKRHELLWTEVTASNLVKVDMRDDLDESAGVNRPGFTLHGGGAHRTARTSTARCTSTPKPAWRSAVSSTACGWCRSRRCAFTTASATTPMKASPRISASARASCRRSATTAR